MTKQLDQALKNARNRVAGMNGFRIVGRLDDILGVMMSARLRQVKIGEVCRVESHETTLLAEVVGFRNNVCLLMPYTYTNGLQPDARVVPTGRSFTLKCGSYLLGKILNGLGDRLCPDTDQPDWYRDGETIDVHRGSPNPITRSGITEPLTTGIRAVDAFLTIGKGQRIGVFAAAGTGKTTLMADLAQTTDADVIVVNLIGERGREVREFIDNSLPPDTLKRSVVVAATSDQPAIVRQKSAYVATTIAEYFRDQGKNVLLMMDSVTRFARALREIGLARGEIPSRAGYPPSVFAELPRLLERAGNNSCGSITAVYTVLVAGDDLNEPVADEVMSILDGHIILSRKLAAENRYPAIDILKSKSRVMQAVITPEHCEIRSQILSKYALYAASEDAIRFGFYETGKNPELDTAVRLKSLVDDWMFAPPDITSSISDTVLKMRDLERNAHHDSC